jgi:hypothetical protein
LLNLLTVSSLVLLTVVVAICLLGQRECVCVAHDNNGQYHVSAVCLSDGVAILVGEPSKLWRGKGWVVETIERHRSRDFYGSENSFAGFYFSRSSYRGTREWYVGFPYWFLIILTSAVAIMAIVLLRRHGRRRITGACINCGYDLRATPERCPECGTIPTTSDVNQG